MRRVRQDEHLQDVERMMKNWKEAFDMSLGDDGLWTATSYFAGAEQWHDRCVALLGEWNRNVTLRAPTQYEFSKQQRAITLASTIEPPFVNATTAFKLLNVRASNVRPMMQTASCSVVMTAYPSKMPVPTGCRLFAKSSHSAFDAASFIFCRCKALFLLPLRIGRPCRSGQTLFAALPVRPWPDG
jgi:hypothetical protein